MPNGPAHRTLTVLAAFPPILSLISPLTWDNLAFLGVFEAGVIATFWINPDTDLKQKLGDVGKVMGYKDYEVASLHRSGITKASWRRMSWRDVLFQSHLPIIGSVLPFLMLITPVVIIGLMAGLWTGQLVLVVCWAFAGMAYSNLIHIVADILVSWFKRWKNGRV